MLEPINLSNQSVECIALHQLIANVTRAGLVVSRPVIDDGVDFYLHRPDDRHRCLPVQLKSSSKRRLSIDAKYANRGILMVFAWYVCEPGRTIIYAMTYDELADICKPWLDSATWLEGRSYSSPTFSKDQEVALERCRATPERWRELMNMGDQSGCTSLPVTQGDII